MPDCEKSCNSGEFTAFISALSVCAGYLNCIFMQGQLQRPLTHEEHEAAQLEASNRFLLISKALAQNHKNRGE